MELSTRYNPQEVEGKWYDHWMEKNYFHSVPDEREAFSKQLKATLSGQANQQTIGPTSTLKYKLIAGELPPGL